MTRVKTYLAALPTLGRAIHRVSAALARYAPDWVEVVRDPTQADLRIWHVLGAGERTPLLATPLAQRFALIQYCLRTTEHPHTGDWLDLWQHAVAVWSYYDLPLLVERDGGSASWMHDWDAFYYAPLGVDTAIFSAPPRPKRFLVGTSGYVAATEGIPEWAAVCDALGHVQFHLGPALSELSKYHMAASGLTDEEVALRWAECNYVAAMRRIEGLELPGIEGLLCGTRPVCFDQPHYRQWYEDKAFYVKEIDPPGVIEELLTLVQTCDPRVPEDDIRWARDRFDWAQLVPPFWQRIQEGL